MTLGMLACARGWIWEASMRAHHPRAPIRVSFGSMPAAALLAAGCWPRDRHIPTKISWLVVCVGSSCGRRVGCHGWGQGHPVPTTFS